MQHLEQASNEELLSTLAGKSAAAAMLQRYGGLTSLAQASFDELRGIRGIGRSRAAAIKSAFLLAARLTRETYAEAPLIDTPERIADLLREEYRLSSVEQFHVLCLSVRRRLIADHRIAQGTLDAVLVHPREVFAPAIAEKAAVVAFAHNHPSGDPLPSEGDIRMTRDLVRAGQLLRIEVVDHVILGRRTIERPKDFVSMRELGYLYH